MFKTIRHGENVLEYTILPQDEEGASSGMGIASRGVTPVPTRGSRSFVACSSHRRRSRGSIERRSRRKSMSIWIILAILVCIVVTAAVLIPVLLSNNPGQFPPNKKFQTFAVAASSLKQHGGRYNIHGTQYIALVPVEQIEGPGGLFEQLDGSKLSLGHGLGNTDSQPEQRDSAVISASTTTTQSSTSTVTRDTHIAKARTNSSHSEPSSRP